MVVPVVPTLRPDIQFIPISTDEKKIRFFGTLMPSLLLLKASPARFLQSLIAARRTPHAALEEFIAQETDDALRLEDMLIFVHRWNSLTFDAFTFARARVFLAQVTRLLQKEGYRAEPFDPLSPGVNLPQLAERAGLGNLSPYGLLVHPAFGPRLIISAVRTDHPLQITARHTGAGCIDCMACVRDCPQSPADGGIIRLKQCQSCAKCLAVCPVGIK
jgi:epoxyqueuosine reductase